MFAKGMKRVFTFIISNLLLISIIPSLYAMSDTAGMGPITYKNSFPLYLLFFSFTPDRAQTLTRGSSKFRLDTGIQNFIVDDEFDDYDAVVDMEVIRTSLNLNYGVRDDLEMGIEIPFYILYKGFLDSFILDFENSIHAYTPMSRQNNGVNNFTYLLRHGNETLISMDSPYGGIGDIALTLKIRHLYNSKIKYMPSISTRYAIKVPTGDNDRFLGSGEVDLGIGVILEKSFGILSNYINLNGIFSVGDPDLFKDMEMDPIFSYTIGTEFPLTERSSLLLQLIGNTSPFPETGLTSLDNQVMDFLLGFNYLIGKDKVFQFGLTENILDDSSPDFSIHVGISMIF
ncbi:MAG: DUF3187 family protein [Nitrospinae bacterium]|nr:DUF3187 family protein [Nitrospinota bacterium]